MLMYTNFEQCLNINTAVFIGWQSHVNYEYKPRQQQQHSRSAIVFESKADTKSALKHDENLDRFHNW